ncbi:kinase-like domain-containing protein [Xylariales sp. AK1849]|nr:kinase-like domain-containing protein [Xylariales sp. AK1849]
MMGDSTKTSGWQTVLPTTHNRVERLEKAQLETYERRAIDLWATLDGDWSGCGKHASDFVEAKKLHNKLKQTIVQDLGFGGQGTVQKFNYTHKNRSVALARKRLYHRRLGIEILREEANVLERLCHDHIVKLVGTYCYQHRELYLILWPAATCDLSHLLGDLDDLRFNGGDRADILERLGQLDLDDTSAVDGGPYSARVASKGNCPLSYLRRIMGCVTRAVDYCHASKIRHLDLKPQNILLSPGRVYLADFGISRDVNDQDHTRTYLENGSLKWLSPERLFPQDDWSMQSADIYSLGLVFLNMATIMYCARQSGLFDVLEQKDRHVRLQHLDAYLEELQKLALVTQEFADENAHTYAPKHVVGLTKRMMSPEPSKRPSMAKVNEELATLGGVEQIYHGSCCRVPARSMTQLLDRKYAQACDERRRLAEENDRMTRRLHTLESREEMYNMRVENEREKHAKDRANLARQLEEEQSQRKQLEARLRELEQNRRHRPGMPPPERSISGLSMKHNRHPPRYPSQPQQPSKSVVSVNVAAPSPRPTSPYASRRQNSDLRQSTESLTNFTLRSRNSGSRLPQPVYPSTPIRSETPSTLRDTNLTDSTIDSLASSMFSHGSRRTTGSGLSPNPSPSASKIISGPETEPRMQGQTGKMYGPSYSSSTRTATGDRRSKYAEHEVLQDGSERGGSLYDGASQHRTEESDVSAASKVPSLPAAKSWAAIAGDRQGLASMIGVAVGKKQKV